MRNHRIEIRLNDEELGTLNRRRGALRLRSFIRVAVLDTAPPIIPAINQQAFFELQKIGTNLNQIAKKLNANFDIDTDTINNEIKHLRFALIEASAA